MKRAIFIVFLLSLITLFSTAVPAYAQTDPIEFHISFGEDVDPGAYPWEEYIASPYGNVASVHGNPVPSIEGEESGSDETFTYGTAAALITLPDGCELLEVTWDSFEEDTYSWGFIHHDLWLYDEDMELIGSMFGQYLGTIEKGWLTAGPVNNAIGGASVERYLEVNLTVPIASEIGPMSGGVLALDNIHFTCEGIEGPEFDDSELYQPIIEDAQIDVLTPMSGSDISGASRITAVVTNPPLFPDEVQVYASMNGIIASMRQTGSGTYNVIITSNEYGVPLALTLNNLSRVYVAVGDEVEAGCVIGLAGPVREPVELEEPVADPAAERQIYFSLRDTASGDFIDWTAFIDPSGDTLCAQSETSCINRNPSLTSGGEFWTPALGLSSSQNVIFSDQGALIPPGASISQHLLLPEAGEWDLTISVTPDLPYTTPGTIFASVKVDLGNVSITEPLTLNLAQTTTLVIGPLDPGSPTIAPDVYRLRITNEPVTSDRLVPLKVQFACLSPSGVSGPPGACYFMDSDFDDGAGWTLFDAFIKPIWAPFDDQGSMLVLEPDGFATTSFTLSGYASADATYRVTLWANGSTVDPDQHSILNTYFDATDDDGDFVYETDIDPGFVEFGSWLRESFVYTVPAGETYSGDFTLFNETEDGVPLIDDIAVDSVCLEPVNGVWPDYEDVAPLPYVPAGCAAVPTPPISGDVATWVAWVGALIRYFWTCQAPLWVNSILKDIQGVQDWIALLGRWFAIVFYDLGQFMWRLTQWGVYSLYNLIAGLVEEMWSVSSGAITLPWDGFSLLLALLWTLFTGVVTLTWTLLMALISLAWTLFIGLVTLLWNVFSTLVVAFWTAITSLPLIDLFSFASVISELLFAIIAQVLSLIVTAFGVLVTMAQIVGIFFTSIQTGFNGSTSADLGVIDCATMLTTEPMYPFCMGIDVVEYAIAAFPAFNILGLALMGAMAYHTLRLTIDWYKQAFAEAS